MRITIDTEAGTLGCTENGDAAEYSLYSPDAFRILSREWIALGWNLGHWASFSWMGRQLLQLPDDVLRLAELLWQIRPDVIVETGVYDGGSTLLFASLCRLSGTGRVISVERELREGVREAIREGAGDLVAVIEGDSSLAETAQQVREMIRPGERVCLFLDSDHSMGHVGAELRNLGPLVSAGCYAIVADSVCRDLAHMPQGEVSWIHDHPGAAVDEFLRAHPEFVRERPVPLFSSGVDFSEVSYFPATWLKRQSAS